MSTEQRNIIHILNRFAFGPSSLDIPGKLSMVVDDVISDLFESSAHFQPLKSAPLKPIINPYQFRKLDNKQKNRLRKKRKLIMQSLNLEWLNEMAFGKAQLREKMALFWHDHFACSSLSPLLVQKQMNTIRENALEYFGDLVLNIAKDPAMINYLNNKQNVKDNPNENFGRELLELFTLGIGHYSEKDIKEASRAFTGWRYKQNTFEFFIDKTKQDHGKKTFLGRTDYFSGEDIIKIIFENPRSGEFIVEKIYKYLTGKKINSQKLKQLSVLFYESSYHIGTLLRAIIKDDDFYSEELIGNRIKSPIELIVNIMRITQLKFKNPVASINIQRKLGQQLFEPPNVSGWVEGKNWLDLGSISQRLNLTALLISQSNIQNKVSSPISTESIELVIQKKEMETETTFNLEPILNLLNEQNHKSKARFMANILYGKNHQNLNMLLRILNRGAYKNLINCKKLLVRLMSQPEYQLN